MKAWFSRVALLAILVLLGFWLWRVIFPDPVHVIRKRLLELARTASYSGKEGLIAKAYNSEQFGSFFDNEVEAVIDVPGRSQQTFHGRAELVQAAMAVRSTLGGLSVDFLDINVSLAPDKTSAEVDLTGRAKIPGEREFFVQELKFTLKKIGREWLINKVETIKTLSQTQRDFRPAPRLSPSSFSGPG